MVVSVDGRGSWDIGVSESQERRPLLPSATDALPRVLGVLMAQKYWLIPSVGFAPGWREWPTQITPLLQGTPDLMTEWPGDVKAEPLDLL